jgi:hypothetical protein
MIKIGNKTYRGNNLVIDHDCIMIDGKLIEHCTSIEDGVESKLSFIYVIIPIILFIIGLIALLLSYA